MTSSWILGLLVLAGSVGWALDAPQTNPGDAASDVPAGAAPLDLALAGVADAGAAHTGADARDTIAAAAALLDARHDVRGHDLDGAQRSLDAARFVVEALRHSDDSAERAHALHLAAANGQLHRLAEARDLSPDAPTQHDPVAAVLALAASHGIAADAIDPAALAGLQGLEPDVRDALGAVIVGFLAYQSADRAVESSQDLPHVIVARTHLVLAAERLAALSGDMTGGARMTPLQIANVLSVDLGPGPNAYDDHFLLLIDAGGDDVYRNNAGGSGATEPRCKLTSGRAAAALIDLSGNDRYVGGLDCGANGGGFNGAGLLYDNQGNDVYRAGSEATNGGALQQATGLILDVRGHDVYEAGDRATNGGADAQALGMIVDASGDDGYSGGGRATNGGGVMRGLGALVDGAGHDTYGALGRATNGGAADHGYGFLVDVTGDDQYGAGGEGANGGATDLGTGALVDLAGRDGYVAAGLGSNGGGARGGIGLLVDHVGNDRYDSGTDGVNGGAYAGGLGLLLDAAGHDRYVAELRGVNGGAIAGAPGDDEPENEVCPTHLFCFTPTASWGLLMDLGGTDTFLEHDADPSGTDRSVVPKGIVGAQLDFVPDPDLPFGRA